MSVGKNLHVTLYVQEVVRDLLSHNMQSCFFHTNIKLALFLKNHYVYILYALCYTPSQNKVCLKHSKLLKLFMASPVISPFLFLRLVLASHTTHIH